MKRILLLLLIVVFSISLLGCSKIVPSQPTPPQSGNLTIINNIEIDKDYLLALNSVNQFLGAWLMRDQQKGSEFITENLRKTLNENELFAFFVGTSNPHHQGFEIIGRERIEKTTIRFNVWLYEYYTGESPTPKKRGNPYYIDVVKVDEYRWLVNNLPK